MEKCLQSLLSQKNKEYLEILLCDHSPNEEAKKFIVEHFSEESFQIFSRRGNHSEGHNFLLEKAQGEFYFCGSFDAEYSPDFFETLLKCTEKKNECEIFSPKISLLSAPEILDSTGIQRKSFFRFSDRGHEEIDYNQYDEKREIFGASGAAFLASQKLLQTIVRKNGFLFDPDLHYKNDIDLAFRAKNLGIRTCYCPEAKMLHDRRTRKKDKSMQEDSFFGHRVLFSKFARSPGDFLGQFFRDAIAVFLAPRSFLHFWKWKKNRRK